MKMTINKKDGYNTKKFKVEFEIYGRYQQDVENMIIELIAKGERKYSYEMRKKPVIKVLRE